MVSKQAHIADLVDLDVVFGRFELVQITPGFLALLIRRRVGSLLRQGLNGLRKGVGLGVDNRRHGGRFGEIDFVGDIV